MKKIITKNEYLQLVGLVTLATQYRKKFVDAESAMAELLNSEDGYLDHLSDELWEENPNLDSVLKRMEIEVDGE